MFNVTQKKYRFLGLCADCGDVRSGSRLRCSACLKRVNGYNKARRENWRAANSCLNCGAERRVEGLISCESCKNRTFEKNARTSKQFKRDYAIVWRQKQKAEVFAAYGGKCTCCDEDNLIFLSIDHKNNDGAEHRKVITPGSQFYGWLKRNKYPSAFQILCHNCNHGKYLNGGVCPHKGAGEMNVWQLVENATQNIGSIALMLQ